MRRERGKLDEYPIVTAGLGESALVCCGTPSGSIPRSCSSVQPFDTWPRLWSVLAADVLPGGSQGGPGRAERHHVPLRILGRKVQ